MKPREVLYKGKTFMIYSTFAADLMELAAKHCYTQPLVAEFMKALALKWEAAGRGIKYT